MGKKLREIIKNFNSLLRTKLMGGYIKRFRWPYIFLLLTISVFEIYFLTRETIFYPHTGIRHPLYIICYSVMLAVSLAAAIFLFLQKYYWENEQVIVVVIHSYAFIALIWGTAVSLLDYVGGHVFPVVFFTILVTLGGLLVLNPFISIPTFTFFLVGLFIGMHLINPEILRLGTIINVSILFFMVCVISIKNTAVAITEEKQKQELISLSKHDVLTSLGNDCAYKEFLKNFDAKYGNDSKYAIIVMDINALKCVNDQLGHRFGDSLITQAGERLGAIFNNTDIFHTSGDEFVGVVVDEFDSLDQITKQLKEKLEYVMTSFEGEEFPISIAFGVGIHEPGEEYKETYQRADSDMYKNKEIIKKKYGIKCR